MPTLNKLLDGTIQVTITENEVIELRADSNCTETVGQVVQDILARTLGYEEQEDYYVTLVKGAVDASFDEERRVWKYVYNMNEEDERGLVF